MLTFFIQSLLFLNSETLYGLKHQVYVLIKILKFCTGSSAKSYQCKFGISEILRNREVAAEDLGKAIQEVIHYRTLRGKFSSVHPELRREGIIRVDVGEKGLHFVRFKGFLLFETFISPKKNYLRYIQLLYTIQQATS